jgi:hypothetical protein
MARRKEGGIGATATIYQDTESSELTFAALDARIEALPESPSNSAIFPKKAKWGLSATAAGAVFGLLSVKLLPGTAISTLVLAYTGLAIEIAGAIVFAISQLPKKWPTFANERRDFAEQLDFDLPHHLALVAWLKTFPLDQRETPSDFIGYRHARMKEKLALHR